MGDKTDQKNKKGGKAMEEKDLSQKKHKLPNVPEVDHETLKK